MKTKIIYISGGEVFEMRDIRAAFDEVRGALGLDTDTVLFGVPVDADDALAAPVVTDDATALQTNDAPDIAPVENTPAENIPADTEDAPVQKKSRGRRPKATQPDATITDASVNDTAATDDAPTPPVAAESEITEIPAPNDDNMADKVIPILSFLGAKHDDAADTDVEPAPAGDADVSTDADDEIIEDVSIDDAPVTDTADEMAPAAQAAPIVSNIEIVTTTIADADTDETLAMAQRVTIEDMITDDAPVAPVEKTLEQLLESMTPLREDQENAPESFDDDDMDADDILDTDDVAPGYTPDETDATLAQLANEFAQNEDKIVTSPKPQSGGKIGKLKNILPFKKARRDDSGLMGDLFGWAGVAANDDDFAIPGFFTGATSDK